MVCHLLPFAKVGQYTPHAEQNESQKLVMSSLDLTFRQILYDINFYWIIFRTTDFSKRLQ